MSSTFRRATGAHDFEKVRMGVFEVGSKVGDVRDCNFLAAIYPKDFSNLQHGSISALDIEKKITNPNLLSLRCLD